jgi:hypothetical protein
MGAPFKRPSLVIWTVPVTRGGGSGRLNQSKAAPMAATDAASAAHFSQARRFGAATGGKDGDESGPALGARPVTASTGAMNR